MIVFVPVPILTIGVMEMSAEKEQRQELHTGEVPQTKPQQTPADSKLEAVRNPEQRHSLAEERLQKWLDDMEHLRLTEYLRYVEDRRRLFWSSFWSGIARGLGMAIGFTILGALLVLILQDLARHNLPLIGKLLDEIMLVVQNGMK